MSVMIEKLLYNIEDFDRFLQQSENVDRLFELIHGEIVEKVPTQEHGIIAGNFQAALWNYVKPRKLGRVAVEVSHRMPGERYNDRMPDVSFYAASSDAVVKQGSVPRMPDLAVEVKSPNNTYKDQRAKAEYYLQNGTKIVWLVFPDRREIEVCTLTADRAMQIETLDIEAALDGKDLLPGFTMSVQDVFDLG